MVAFVLSHAFISATFFPRKQRLCLCKHVASLWPFPWQMFRIATFNLLPSIPYFTTRTSHTTSTEYLIFCGLQIQEKKSHYDRFRLSNNCYFMEQTPVWLQLRTLSYCLFQDKRLSSSFYLYTSFLTLVILFISHSFRNSI